MNAPDRFTTSRSLFAENLRRRMVDAGENTTTLSRSSGISRSVLSRLASGTRSPQLFHLVKLAGAFNATVDELARDVFRERPSSRSVTEASADLQDAAIAFAVAALTKHGIDRISAADSERLKQAARRFVDAERDATMKTREAPDLRGLFETRRRKS